MTLASCGVPSVQESLKVVREVILEVLNPFAVLLHTFGIGPPALGAGRSANVGLEVIWQLCPAAISSTRQNKYAGRPERILQKVEDTLVVLHATPKDTTSGGASSSSTMSIVALFGVPGVYSPSVRVRTKVLGGW